MDFSEALIELKNGQHLCRAGWNGSGLCVLYIPAAKIEGWTYTAHFVLNVPKTETFSTWVPSSSDLVAEDWEIYHVERNDGELTLG